MNQIPGQAFCWIIFALLNYKNIQTYPQNPDCAGSVDLYPLALFINIQMLNTCVIFILLDKCLEFWSKVIFTCFFNFMLIFIISLPIYVYTYIKTPDCMDNSFLSVNIVILGFLNLLSYPIVFMTLKRLSKSWVTKRKKKEVGKAILDLYTSILSPNFNAAEFLNQNQQIINSLPLMEEEFAILKDKFGFKYYQNDESDKFDEDQLNKENDLKSNRNDIKTLEEDQMPNCIICLGDFEAGQSICGHPHCQHPFHIVCLEEWLRIRPNCPICKVGTRISMIKDLTKNLEKKITQNKYLYPESFMKNDKLIED